MMTFAAIGALLFGFLLAALVASDVRFAKHHDWVDYGVSIGVGLGSICTIAIALRYLVP